MNYVSDRFLLFVYIPDVRGYGVLFTCSSAEFHQHRLIHLHPLQHTWPQF